MDENERDARGKRSMRVIGSKYYGSGTSLGSKAINSWTT